jgi:hypothetical protein
VDFVASDSLEVIIWLSIRRHISAANDLAMTPRTTTATIAAITVHSYINNIRPTTINMAISIITINNKIIIHTFRLKAIETTGIFITIA